MNVTCVVAERANEIAVRHCSLREPGDHEILIRTMYSCISPGTELRCLAGQEPNAGKFPMITGYSLVGRVIKGAGAIQEGNLVFANGTSVVPDGITSAWGGASQSVHRISGSSGHPAARGGFENGLRVVDAVHCHACRVPLGALAG